MQDESEAEESDEDRTSKTRESKKKKQINDQEVIELLDSDSELSSDGSNNSGEEDEVSNNSLDSNAQSKAESNCAK